MGAQTEQQCITETVVAHVFGMSSSGVNRVIERGSAASIAATVMPNRSTRYGGGL
jgi:hypothetical protein